LSARYDQGARGVLWVSLLLLATAAFGGGLVYLQRRGPVSAVWRWVRRLAPRGRFVARLGEGARAIDARLEAFYRIERGALWRAAGSCSTGSASPPSPTARRWGAARRHHAPPAGPCTPARPDGALGLAPGAGSRGACTPRLHHARPRRRPAGGAHPRGPVRTV